MSSIPWVESYRPNNFEDVVLDPLNKLIMKNIIETSYFPHLLLYGPPGTGKTSSAMILINEYHKKHNQKSSELTITLNACLLYTSPSPRDGLLSRMPSSA